MDIPETEVVERAAFQPVLRWFWFSQGLLLLVVTIVGIVLVPFWVLGLGQWVVGAAFGRLQCVLTRRALHLRKGLFFRQEKSVPLDKIQDLTWHQDPLMRLFGIEGLRIETAGAAGHQAVTEAGILGIADAREFRDRVLAERDRTVAGEGDPTALLQEIRDSLTRIEALLGGRVS